MWNEDNKKKPNKTVGRKNVTQVLLFDIQLWFDIDFRWFHSCKTIGFNMPANGIVGNANEYKSQFN